MINKNTHVYLHGACNVIKFSLFLLLEIFTFLLYFCPQLYLLDTQKDELLKKKLPPYQQQSAQISAQFNQEVVSWYIPPK